MSFVGVYRVQGWEGSGPALAAWKSVAWTAGVLGRGTECVHVGGTAACTCGLVTVPFAASARRSRSPPRCRILVTSPHRDSAAHVALASPFHVKRDEFREGPQHAPTNDQRAPEPGSQMHQDRVPVQRSPAQFNRVRCPSRQASARVTKRRTGCSEKRFEAEGLGSSSRWGPRGGTRGSRRPSTGGQPGAWGQAGARAPQIWQPWPRCSSPRLGWPAPSSPERASPGSLHLGKRESLPPSKQTLPERPAVGSRRPRGTCHICAAQPLAGQGPPLPPSHRRPPQNPGRGMRCSPRSRACGGRRPGLGSTVMSP